jgi:hypothetical protein
MERIVVVIICVLLYGFLWLNKKTLGKLFLEKETITLLHILERGEVEQFSSQRINRGLCVLGLAILSYLLGQGMLNWMSLVICALIVIKWPEITLKRIYQRRLNQLKIEFPIWLRQLQILLQHNTVLQSLRLSQSHAPILFKVALKELVIQLENTPQDLSLYTSFLSDYQSIEVQRAMKLLYRYNAIGSDDSTRQLSRLILATTKWLRDQRSSIHSTTLSLTGWWGMCPLLGVSGLFLVMMVQTMLTLLERR